LIDFFSLVKMLAYNSGVSNMLTRVKLDIPQTEYDALLKLAIVELRSPQDQLRHILRRELERRGLLPADPAPAAQPQAEGVAHD
jgi:hypothetical protein